MPYDAKIVEVMIASPSDVSEERQIVRDVISQWNAAYSRDRNVVLMPVGWESHTSPELSGRPQQMINDRLLTHADLLVGIFWTRVGTPTGKAISGSIEEIEEHMKRQKPVMLYFSSVPVTPDSVEAAQYEQLKNLKSWARERGLVETFESREDFRDKFQRQLPLTLKDNPHLRNIFEVSAGEATPSGDDNAFPISTRNFMSDDAREILESAAADKNGMIMIRHHLAGTSIQAGGKTFVNGKDPRLVARWEAAVEELSRRGLLRDINGKGEIFKVTHTGYGLVEAGGR